MPRSVGLYFSVGWAMDDVNVFYRRRLTLFFFYDYDEKYHFRDLSSFIVIECFDFCNQQNRWTYLWCHVASWRRVMHELTLFWFTRGARLGGAKRCRGKCRTAYRFDTFLCVELMRYVSEMPLLSVLTLLNHCIFVVVIPGCCQVG